VGFATCAFSLHITSQILKFRTKARIENEAKNTLPQGFTVDYAGESRQLRVEGSKFLGMFWQLNSRTSAIPLSFWPAQYRWLCRVR
jgi:hypothetical protein